MRTKDTAKYKTGLHDDFDATISKSRFRITDESQDKSALSLSFTLEDKHIRPIEVAFDIGDGWQIIDDGHYVKHPLRRNFVARSEIGHLIMRVVKDLNVHMWERGVPTHADVWVGLKFHWKIEGVSLEKWLLGGEASKIVRLMPTKFLGGHENSNDTEELARLIRATKPDDQVKPDR
jgi:hypothetical protein